jgi:hypothetical protein
MDRARIERGSYRKFTRDDQQSVGVDHPPQVFLTLEITLYNQRKSKAGGEKKTTNLIQLIRLRPEPELNGLPAVCLFRLSRMHCVSTAFLIFHFTNLHCHLRGCHWKEHVPCLPSSFFNAFPRLQLSESHAQPTIQPWS